MSRPQLTTATQWLAFGLGSGLASKAPGTWGSLAAVPLFLIMANLSLPLYTLIVVVAGVGGIWICGRASAELGVHDHPGIVWDEFVGLWITLWAVPASIASFEGFVWLLGGFALFRLLDIWKPWPIRWFDKNVHGGLGIMIDDVIAGVIACAILQVLRLWV